MKSTASLSGKNEEDLKKEEIITRKDIRNATIEVQTGKSTNVRLAKNLKRRLARIKTLLRKIEIQKT